MEPFKPNRGPLKLSENMIIENLAKVLDIATETVDSIADVTEDLAGADSPNDWRAWSAEETQAAIGAQQSFTNLQPAAVWGRRLNALPSESGDVCGLLEHAHEAKGEALKYGSGFKIMTMMIFS